MTCSPSNFQPPETVTIYALIKIISEANCRQRWQVKNARKKHHLKILDQATPKILPVLPAKIILTRVSPRKLDFDNLVYAMKYYRDFIADKLLPGLQIGRADDSELMIFEYCQRKGDKNEYALQIDIDHIYEKKSLKQTMRCFKEFEKL